MADNITLFPSDDEKNPPKRFVNVWGDNLTMAHRCVRCKDIVVGLDGMTSHECSVPAVTESE